MLTVKTRSLDGVEGTVKVREENNGRYGMLPPMEMRRAMLPPMEMRRAMADKPFTLYYDDRPPAGSVALTLRLYRLERYRHADGRDEFIYVEQQSDEVSRLHLKIDHLNSEIERLNRELGEAWANALDQGDEL